MNKILIITTKGCEGCYVAEQNVNSALLQTSKKIEVDIKDCQEIEKVFLKKNNITDYPTVIYFVDGKIVNKAIGSYPVSVYLRWIDMYFKMP